MIEVKDRNILDQFCIDFCSIVQKYCQYIVCSGFVAIASGRTRGTEDIDIIIERLPLEKFDALHTEMTSNDFECLQSNDPKTIHEYLEKDTSVRYVRKGKMLPEMELKFVKDELDKYQIQTKQKLELTGLDIWFSSINMNIAFKECLRKSDKDLEDAQHLRTVYEELVDEDEIKKIQSLIKRFRL